jgi:hypothetical protein
MYEEHADVAVLMVTVVGLSTAPATGEKVGVATVPRITTPPTTSLVSVICVDCEARSNGMRSKRVFIIT